ncbi:catalytic phage domain protein : Marine sediment metagenome DNA, contig: S01H1_L02182 (Fragment) OS=marine sediment metagenome GN=S01H1_07804 PE=4 SV=1 [Gemmata massiliana]|uniref:Catalytic phage domain protein: Marine sediment metagenome DNA, contig: S01H1_L02182 n=2 Tax=Gemmata massiliana TaxID=1210884 RepID=A0A6P2DDZ2_9BACT
MADAYQEAGRERDARLRRDLNLPVVFVAGCVVDPSAPLFSPADSREEWGKAARAKRESEVPPSQMNRRPAHPKKQPGKVNTVAAYGYAGRSAARKTGVPNWHPNQLRHTFATEVRKALWLEAAPASLGRSRADATRVYAEHDLALTLRVAAEMGSAPAPRRRERVVAQMQGCGGNFRPRNPKGFNRFATPIRSGRGSAALATTAQGDDVSEDGSPRLLRPFDGGRRPRAALLCREPSCVRGGRECVQLVDPSGYFADFEPITDFLHAVCYVYRCARVVSIDEPSGWSQYLVWMRACWEGRVAEVLSELDAWQERLGQPLKQEDGSESAGSDPRVVYQGRTYLRNNQDRVAYPRYRWSGCRRRSV